MLSKKCHKKKYLKYFDRRYITDENVTATAIIQPQPQIWLSNLKIAQVLA